jgi:hypothetical protein
VISTTSDVSRACQWSRSDPGFMRAGSSKSRTRLIETPSLVNKTCLRVPGHATPKTAPHPPIVVWKATRAIPCRLASSHQDSRRKTFDR